MDDTARMFKALSDGTRLRIVALLARGERCVCDLMAVLDLPQSTVSRHLAYLRNAGWVTGRRSGMWMHYRLRTDLPPLQGGVLTLLQGELQGNDRARRDLAALEEYLITKSRPCSD